MPKTQKKEENHYQISIGERLKACRESKKLSLEKVSEHLCITKSNLAKLENECETLERNVYTIGFVRSYANYIGLDPEEMAIKFKESCGHTATRNISPDYDFLRPMPRSGVPKTRSIFLSIMLLGLVGALIYGGSKEIASHKTATNSEDGFIISQVEEDTSIVPDEKPTATLLQVSAIESGSPEKEILNPLDSKMIGATLTEKEEITTEVSIKTETEAQPTAPIVQPAVPSVKIIATEDAWVELRSTTGKVIFDKVMRSGESQQVSEPKNITLTTGNAAGVELMIGDKKINKLGNSGEVKRNISLDPEKVLAEFSLTE